MNLFKDVTSKEELLGQLTGAASTCWEHLELAGEFDSTRATYLVTEAIERLNQLVCGGQLD